MNNMWRSIAKYARQQIVQSDPSQVEAILKVETLYNQKSAGI